MSRSGMTGLIRYALKDISWDDGGRDAAYRSVELLLRGLKIGAFWPELAHRLFAVITKDTSHEYGLSSKDLDWFAGLLTSAELGEVAGEDPNEEQS